MTANVDHGEEIRARVEAAFQAGRPLVPTGHGSKRFLDSDREGEVLSLAQHRGIVKHEPTELILTARAGTPLAEIEAALAEAGQMLAFEPPRFAGHGTLGGAVATGLAGPRRPFAGRVRDFVLGTRFVNGRGEALRFGGEVMKNVAGYDVSRLMVGAMGSLGVLLEITLKVLPRPECERALVLELGPEEAFRHVAAWEAEGLPVSGSAHDGLRLHLRLSGAESAVAEAVRRTGGENDSPGFWEALRDHELDWFRNLDGPPWRVVLPAGRRLPEGLAKRVLADWNGRQLWLDRVDDPVRLEEAAAAVGGSLMRFGACGRGGQRRPEARPGRERLERRVKEAFDPAGILNSGAN